MTHICVVKLTIIGSDNGLSPGQRQAIIWTNDGIFLIGPLRTNFIENLIGIQTFSFKKMHLKMSSAKWRPFCLGLNVLISLLVKEDLLTEILTGLCPSFQLIRSHIWKMLSTIMNCNMKISEVALVGSNVTEFSIQWIWSNAYIKIS